MKFHSILVTILSCMSFICHAQKEPRMQAENRVIFKKYDTTYIFYTTVKKVKNLKPDVFYYWYSLDSIFLTQQGYSGKLLDGSYSEYYPTKNLMAQGHFKMGLRHGEWKRWYVSGVLKDKYVWKDGVMDGSFSIYDSVSKIKTKGSYKDNKIDGYLSTFVNDSIVSKFYYKDGRIILQKKSAKSGQ